ncbi:MAG: substrate-binding domain-containing protein [Actinobacteria bacterium]|nr:substrate-binding domain-containing protein [Actinomycetota bacterium]
MKKLTLLLAALAFAVVLSACGSSGGSTTGESSTSGSAESASGGESINTSSKNSEYAELMGNSKYSTPTLVPAAKAEKEGEEFADPKPAKLPKLTVGWVNFAKAAESGVRGEYEFIEAAKALGWKVIACDGGGTSTGYTNCMNTLLSQNVEAIATAALEPSVIGAQIKEAHARGIPVVSAGAKVKLGEYDGAFYPTEKITPKLVAEFMIEKLEEKEGTKEIVIHTFPAGFAEARAEGIREAIKSHPDIKIVAENPVEAADAVGGTKKTTETEITQYPNLAAIVDPFDSAISGSAQALATKLPGKAFPEAPLLVGWDALLGSQPYMRQQPPLIAALGDNDYGADSWIAADQLAQYFARKTPISKEPEPNYGIDYLSPQLVTPEDLLTEERYPPNKSNYWAFFKAKWHKEFGVE